MLWDNPSVKSGTERIDKADVGRPDAVAYLASGRAAFVPGIAMRVDSGRLGRR